MTVTMVTKSPGAGETASVSEPTETLHGCCTTDRLWARRWGYGAAYAALVLGAINS